MLEEIDVRQTLLSTKSALRCVDGLLSLNKHDAFYQYRREILDLCYAGTGVEIGSALRRLLIRAGITSTPPCVDGLSYSSHAEAAAELCRTVLSTVWECLEPGEPEGNLLLDKLDGKRPDSRHHKISAQRSAGLPGAVEWFLGPMDTSGDRPLVPFAKARERMGNASVDALSHSLFYALKSLGLGDNTSMLAAQVTREFEEAIAIGLRENLVISISESVRRDKGASNASRGRHQDVLPDGPLAPDKWVYGGATFERLTTKPWRFAAALWGKNASWSPAR